MLRPASLLALLILCPAPGSAQAPAPPPSVPAAASSPSPASPQGASPTSPKGASASSPAGASAVAPAKYSVFLKDGTVIASVDVPLVAFGRVLYRRADGARGALPIDRVDLEKTRPEIRQALPAGPGTAPPHAAANAAPAAAPAFPPAAERRAAPDFTAKRKDGKDVKLSDLKGRVVLVDFWATWCGPCVMEMPNVKRVYKENSGPDFEIVGVSLDHEKTKLDAYLTSEGIAWPQAFDGKGWGNEVARTYGVASIPTMLLLDREGRIARVGVRGPALEAAVKALIAEKAAPAAPKKG